MKEFPLEGRILEHLRANGFSTIVGISNAVYPKDVNRFVRDHEVITTLYLLIDEGRVRFTQVTNNQLSYFFEAISDRHQSL